MTAKGREIEATSSPRDKPVNPFHTHEFAAAELAEDVVTIGWQDFAVSRDQQGNLAALDASLDLMSLARRA